MSGCGEEVLVLMVLVVDSSTQVEARTREYSMSNPRLSCHWRKEFTS